MSAKRCEVKFTMPEAVGISVAIGFENDGIEVPMQSEKTENGVRTCTYMLEEGCYRFLSEGEGYYSWDKDVIVSAADVANGSKTVDADPGKMAGTFWEQNKPVREFSDERIYSESMQLDAAVREKYAYAFTTPSFAAGKARHEFTTQEELEQFIEKCDRSCKNMYVYPLGKSKVHGLTLYAAVFTKTDLSGAKTIDEAAALVNANGKTTVQEQAQVHGNEPSACDGALVMMQQLCGEYGDKILDRVNIVLIPRINVDAARDYTYIPAEEKDINRDYYTMRDVETPMLIHVYNVFQPEVVIDHHEFNTIRKYQLDVKVGGLDSLNLPQQLRDLQYTIFNYEHEKLREDGLRTSYYRDKTANTNPISGRGNYFTRGSIAVLLEITGQRKGKLYWERRVLSQYLGAKNVIDYTAAHAEEVKAVIAQTKADIIRAGETFDPVNNLVYLEHKAGTPFYIKCPTYSLVDGSRQEDEVVRFNKFDRPTLWRARPLAYVIPKSAENVEWILQVARWQNIEYREVAADEKLLLRQYRGGAQAAALNDEQEYTFETGAYLFPMNQIAGVVLSLLMEPDVLDCTQGYTSFVQEGTLAVSDLYRCEHL